MNVNYKDYFEIAIKNILNNKAEKEVMSTENILMFYRDPKEGIDYFDHYIIMASNSGQAEEMVLKHKEGALVLSVVNRPLSRDLLSVYFYVKNIEVVFVGVDMRDGVFVFDNYSVRKRIKKILLD